MLISFASLNTTRIETKNMYIYCINGGSISKKGLSYFRNIHRNNKPVLSTSSNGAAALIKRLAHCKWFPGFKSLPAP